MSLHSDGVKWSGRRHIVFYSPDDEKNAFGIPRHPGELKRVIVLKLIKWLEGLGISKDDFLDAL